jgi:predicted nucleic acid-binding protein
VKERVFVDSSFWIALLDSKDIHFESAKEIFSKLCGKYEAASSEFIVFETITYLNCSLKQHDLAVRFLESIHSSGMAIMPIDSNVRDNAIEMFKQYADKPFSFTDCTSFELMRREDIQLYAGFDKHFQQMGFQWLT